MMALDRIRPNAFIFLHFFLLVISHSPDFCSKQSLVPYNCSSKVFDNLEDGQSCFMNKVTDCENLKFTGDHDVYLGAVNIQTYSIGGVFNFAAFNITFSDIEWESATFRLQLNASASGTASYSVCRQFTISGKISPLKELYYDCNRLEAPMSDHSCIAEVMMKKGSKVSFKKYSFSFPEKEDLEENAETVDKWRVFSYVDISVPKKATVHVQTPQKFGPFNYTFIANTNGKNESKTSNESSASFDLSNGANYKFYVQPIGESCNSTCKVGSTPKIIIEPPSYAGVFYSFIPVIVILALLYLVVFVLLPTKRKYQLIGVDKKKILLMYKANHGFHLDLVCELANFLKTKKMEVLLDVEEIPELENPDPFNWCSKAVKKADFLFLVSSPSCCPNRCDGVFSTKVHDAMTHLISNIALEKTCRPVRILLPYCDEKTDFPEDLDYKMFRIPQEMSSLVNHVHSLNNTVQHIVLPCTNREGNDLTELSKKIYYAGTHQEGHKREESELGSVVSLPVVEESQPEAQFLPAASNSQDDAVVEFPDLNSMQLLGEDEEDPARNVVRPLLNKMNKI